MTKGRSVYLELNLGSGCFSVVACKGGEEEMMRLALAWPMPSLGDPAILIRRHPVEGPLARGEIVCFKGVLDTGCVVLEFAEATNGVHSFYTRKRWERVEDDRGVR